MEITQPRRLVERFYYDVWDRGDETVAREILAPDFRFRGSLGPERIGPDGFIEYMRSIRTALADFECIIDDLIEGDSRVAARMRFRGIHGGQFFGMPATGQEIIWSGAAFFTMDRGHIAQLWVLGDIDAVKQQLGARLGIVLRLTRIIAERPMGSRWLSISPAITISGEAPLAAYRRPFASVAKMDQEMIDRWNSEVRSGDGDEV